MRGQRSRASQPGAPLSFALRQAGRTLYDAIQFSELHQRPPKDTDLSWTHHRLLLRLAHQKERDFYIQQISEEGWSARQLEAAINAGLHLGKGHKPLLKRPTEPDYLYGARVLGVVDGDTLDLEIDLGFGVYRKLRARLANVDAPELTSKKGRAARDFVVQELMTAPTCVVKTVRVDLHGRYVVHLFYTTRVISSSTCFKNGTYLNDLLVQNKHAAVVA